MERGGGRHLPRHLPRGAERVRPALEPRRFDGRRDEPRPRVVCRDWLAFIHLSVDERRAGGLVVEHLLRGFEAVHLAAAKDLSERFSSEEVVFSSFHGALLRAARSEGLSTLHPTVREEFVMEDWA